MICRKCDEKDPKAISSVCELRPVKGYSDMCLFGVEVVENPQYRRNSSGSQNKNRGKKNARG